MNTHRSSEFFFLNFQNSLEVFDEWSDNQNTFTLFLYVSLPLDFRIIMKLAIPESQAWRESPSFLLLLRLDLYSWLYWVLASWTSLLWQITSAYGIGSVPMEKPDQCDCYLGRFVKESAGRCFSNCLDTTK